MPRLRWTWISASIAVTAVAAVLAGSLPVAAAKRATNPFDSTVVHKIAVRYDETEYTKMVENFVATGEKDWIKATVSVDGTTVRNSGMRLKGNSSLMGLRRGTAGAGGVGGPGGGASAATPEKLPWLIRFDEYVKKQNYNGYTEIVVRSNNTVTSLNEAVALELLGKAGLATQPSASSRFSVNGGPTALRLIVESPNDKWDAANFKGDGLLYKAESTGNWSYRGTDAALYEEVFDQETHTDDEDLSPLIEFLDFLNNSDDATFARDLPKRLDVKRFADYLAFEELVANFDDIDGPGNNAYLRYNSDADQFTVIAWDHNLAFGSLGGGGGGQIPGGQNPSQIPGGQIPGGQIPGGQATLTPGGVPPGGGQVRGFGGGTNVLVQRFNANAEFTALYKAAVTELRAKLYASGAAQEILTRRADLLRKQASDLVESATIDAEAAKISSYFTLT